MEDSLGGFNWVERQISGLNQDCFDPRDIAQRFLTLIETRIVLYTTTSTIYEAHPDMQTVSFASKNACLPSNVEGLFERCGK